MKRPFYNAIHSLFHNPKHFIAAILCRIGGCLPDKLYLQWMYYLEVGRHLNLENPQRFGEKMQWHKLYYHNPLYTQLVDKYRVKDYVAEKIGKEYVIPVMSIWNTPEEIDWNVLPNQFVLKTNHDGGGNGIVICRDKNTFSIKKALKEIKYSYRRSSFALGREWPYKNVKKCVLAEQFITDSHGELRDYKFFCFNGKVRCFKIDYNRQTYHQANYYDPQCHLLLYGEAAYPPDFEADILMPENISEMITLAEKLANGIPFVRVDLYNVDGRIYFGEFTFYPAGGMSKWIGSVDVDELWGSWLELPSKNI